MPSARLHSSTLTPGRSAEFAVRSVCDSVTRPLCCFQASARGLSRAPLRARKTPGGGPLSPTSVSTFAIEISIATPSP
jgi:hypothetical protein